MRKNTERWVPYRNRVEVAFSDDPRNLEQLPVERVMAAFDRLRADLAVKATR